MEDLDKIVADYENRSAEIPFGNSAFQNIAFVGAVQGTPERACRAWLLRLSDRIQALREAEFGHKLGDVKLRKLRAKLAKTEDEFEREELEIKIERNEFRRKEYEKMKRDCESEIDVLHRALNAFPVYTKEQFEAAEVTHYEQRLMAQLNDEHRHGALESLRAMNLYLPMFEELVGKQLGDHAELPKLSLNEEKDEVPRLEP